MAEIATAYVQIEPTAKGISGKISTMFGGEGESAGASFNGGFSKALGGLGKVALGATAAVGTAVVALGAKFVSGAGEVAEYGDTIDKMSQKVGLSAEAYQEWDYVMRISGTEMSNMTTGLKTLTNKLDDAKNGSSTAQETFAKLGLSMDDLANMSREEVFSATITAFQGMGESAERAALANDLFGRSGQELAPLFNTTTEQTEALKQQVRDLGGVMSDDAVKASAAYQDQLTALQTAFQGLTRNMMSDFLPSITQVMDGLTDIFSGDSETGLGKIKEGINTIAQGLLDALPQIVQTGSEIIMALGQAIIENLPTLIPVAVDLALTLVDFLVQNAPLLIEAAAQLILQLAMGLAQALPTLIPSIVEVILTIVQYLIDNIDLLVDAAIQLMTGLAMGLIQALPILIEKIPEIIVALVQAIIENAPLILQAIVDVCVMLVQGLATNLAPMVQKAGEVMRNVLETVKTWLSQLPERMAYFAGQAVGKFVQFMLQLPSKLIAIFQNLITSAQNFGTNFIQQAQEFAIGFGNRLIDGLKSLPEKLITVGHNIVEGLKEGISRAWSNLTAWVGDLASNLVAGFKDALGISSPSKIFEDEVGVWIPAGVAEGIEDGMGVLDNAMADMTSDIIPDPTSMVSSYNPASASTTQGSQLYGLLSKYLPMIAENGETPVVLEGDAQGLFNLVRQQNKVYKRMSGESAFA